MRRARRNRKIRQLVAGEKRLYCAAVYSYAVFTLHSRFYNLLGELCK